MKLTIAGLQTAGTPGDVEANLHELDVAAASAAADGVELLITTELFVTGYDIGDLLLELVRRDLLGSVREIAVRHGIALVAGIPELGDDGAVFNTAFFIAPSGDVLAAHRKTHLFGDLDRAYFTPGAEPVTIVEHQGVRIAMMICYDVEFPENVRMAALAGADLVAVPTAQMQPFEFIADAVIRTRAWENQVYIAYINHDGAERDTVYVGRSSIVGPDAVVIDGIETGTGLIRGDIDTDVVREARARNPYLTDARPELYGAIAATLSEANR